MNFTKFRHELLISTFRKIYILWPFDSNFLYKSICVDSIIFLQNRESWEAHKARWQLWVNCRLWNPVHAQLTNTGQRLTNETCTRPQGWGHRVSLSEPDTQTSCFPKKKTVLTFRLTEVASSLVRPLVTHLRLISLHPMLSCRIMKRDVIGFLSPVELGLCRRAVLVCMWDDFGEVPARWYLELSGEGDKQLWAFRSYLDRGVFIQIHRKWQTSCQSWCLTQKQCQPLMRIVLCTRWRVRDRLKISFADKCGALGG